jgi:hypothetical protein
VYDHVLGRVYIFGGKIIDNTMAADLTVLSVRGERTGEWLREERTVLEVDLDPAVFHCILDAIYTGMYSFPSIFVLKIKGTLFGRFHREISSLCTKSLFQ